MSLIFLGLLASVATQAPPSCDSCSLGFLAEADAVPPVAVNFIELRGQGVRGTRVRVTMNRGANGATLSIESSLNERTRLGNVRLDLERFPNLDFGSARLGFDGVAFLEVTVRYGAPRRCFDNDDGRDRIKIEFTQGSRPKVYDMSFAECGTRTEDISESR